MSDPLTPECPHPDSWFSRSICAADDWMHTYCSECGKPLDGKCAERARPAPPEGHAFEPMRGPDDTTCSRCLSPHAAPVDGLDALVLSGKLDCLPAGTVREIRSLLAASPAPRE